MQELSSGILPLTISNTLGVSITFCSSYKQDVRHIYTHTHPHRPKFQCAASMRLIFFWQLCNLQLALTSVRPSQSPNQNPVVDASEHFSSLNSTKRGKHFLIHWMAQGILTIHSWAQSCCHSWCPVSIFFMHTLKLMPTLHTISHN